MCGIAGYLAFGGAETSCDLLLRMVRTMAVRGPDDEGLALLNVDPARALALTSAQTAPGVARAGTMLAEHCPDFAHDVALGHRRFSIVDLSSGGHQPFWSADGQVCVVFNGEVYNHVELREELERLGRTFRTRSDTEVLVEAYRQWGVDCFRRLVGFWAVALYDAGKRALLLARDRVGKAPLYVARHDGKLLFASEIKALHAAAGRSAFAVRGQAIVDFVTFGWRDLFDRTFYEGITSFPAASYAWVARDGSFAPVRYWSLPVGRRTERALPAADAARQLRSLLGEALRVRFRADVPVGVELSGGLDSSALVAIAAGNGQRLRAFTVAFPGTPWDEEPFARLVYERHREHVEYHVVRPTLGDFFDEADSFVAHMDEPFHSPSMESSRRLWRLMADSGIRVSINGAAADECFAGYPGIYHVPFLAGLLASGRLPTLLRELSAFREAPARAFSPAWLARVRQVVAHCLKRQSVALAQRSPALRAAVARGAALLSDVPPVGRRRVGSLEQVLTENMTDWVMNYWLRSGHQNFMGVPVEVRAPFLDHRVVEFAFSLPTTYLVRDGWLKWILRMAVQDILPAEVCWRRNKLGFPFPLETWLPANKARFFAIVQGAGCPHVNLTALRERYDALVRTDAPMLWRAMSVCLWWKRCVLGEALDPGAGSSAVAGSPAPASGTV